MPLTHEQQLHLLAVARVYQARYQAALDPWGVHAHAPVLGEDVDDYRRRLAVQAKRLLPEDHEYAKRQYRKQDDYVLNNYEAELLPAVKQYAYNDASVPFDAPLREIKEVDPQNGLRINRFIGQRSFIHDFTRPGRRVVRFCTVSDNRGRAVNEFAHAR
jgi:hypothetical protein